MSGKRWPSDDWYRPTAANYVCNQHPAPAKALVKALSAHVGMSEGNARHALDRLGHLATCCREPEAITLLRLQSGTRQMRQPTELECEALANGTPPLLFLDDVLP